MKTIGWHFVNEKLRDGRDIPQDGEWLHHEGEVIPCESGLHGSLHIYDALKYAPGNTLCLCEFSGTIVNNEDDKIAAQSRMIIARIDAEKLLREFARWCALQVCHLWDCPPLVKEYLETGNEEIRDAARAAAWDAARDAAWDAAWAAARDAAWDAARDAAWAAAWVAARDAAWAAAWVAARDAARAAAWDAARDAAWAAARDAAEKAQREKLHAMAVQMLYGIGVDYSKLHDEENV